jgi:hypothetical protein
MHTEVHVHGEIPVRRGVSVGDVETALRPWFDYIDVDSLAEATSAREEEPGIALDARRRILQICWTGWVGRNFQSAVEEALAGVGTLAEATAEIEMSFFHEDGRDEFGVVFIGPSPEAIESAKRKRMIQEVSTLLARQFNDVEILEVTTLIEKLFQQRKASGEDGSATAQSIRGPISRGTKHLH